MEEYAWFKSYDPGVPKTLEPYPRKTLLDIVAETTAEKPRHSMLIFMGRYLSYVEMEAYTNAMAAALASMEFKKGDRIAIMLPNCPQYVIAQFGAWKLGGIVAGINPLYTEPELIHTLNECGAEIAVTLTPFYNALKAVQSRTKVRKIIVTSIKDYLKPMLRIAFTLLKEKKEGHYLEKVAEGDHWFVDLVRKYSGAKKPDLQVSPDDPAWILFSGGTTGVPKAAVGTHMAGIQTGMQITRWFASDLKPWTDVFLCPLPLFHAFGNVGVLSVGLVGRGPICLIANPRDRDTLVSTIEKVKPAFMLGVPTLYNSILEHPKVKAGKADFKSMKLAMSGAAPLMGETKKRFEAVTGGRMSEGYGLSESMIACCVSPSHGKFKEGSIGCPVSDVTIRIGDMETGEGSLKPGETGELVMKAPQLMQGYWNRPEETKEMLRDGWLYTGDIGYMDEDGYIFITSRKKDLIKPGGFQVWPREVEEVISAHPSVAEVSVAGIPDPKQTEAVKAWIVLREGLQATPDEIQEFCRKKLTAYKVPKYIEFRKDLPKTLVGKVLRRVLQEEEKSKQQ
jgi:long-chain acyl-CoA synthetase